MEKDDLKFDESLENEEDLLNFDLDDISLDEMDQATGSGSDEDVIELVNLVEEGETAAEEPADMDLGNMLEENQSIEAGLVKDEATADLSDVELSTEAEVLELPEDDMDLADLDLSDLEVDETSRPEEMMDEEEISEDDLEKLLETDADEEMALDISDEREKREDHTEEIETGKQEIFEEDLEGIFEGQMAEEMGMPSEREEAPAAELAEIPDASEDIGEQIEDMEAEIAEMESLESPIEEAEIAEMEATAPAFEEKAEVGEPEEIATEVPPEGIIGISEEKIEAIVTRVVQEVVERVTRETMTSVAEKVISEAIEALKRSLESSSD